MGFIDFTQYKNNHIRWTCFCRSVEKSKLALLLSQINLIGIASVGETMVIDFNVVSGRYG